MYLYLSVLVLTLGLLAYILVKVNKKETYCVDISGGFAPPCGCQGDRVVALKGSLERTVKDYQSPR